MVVSGHPLATLAGWNALAEGGSAADAIIGAAAVLTVVLPQAVSIGGDGVALVFDAATGRVRALNATGPAPASARLEALTAADLALGPCSPTVPGLVAGWAALHEAHGTLPWGRLLGPAIRAAEQGFPVSRTFSATLAEYQEPLAREPILADLFLSAKQPAPEGALLRQPALAATLRALAEQGPTAFYTGAIAGHLVQAVATRGGLLAAADLAAFKPEWAEPLASAYRGHEVHVVPPNSFGLLLLLQLKALSHGGSDAAPLGSAERLKILIGAARSALRVGQDVIADPRFHDLPIRELLTRPLVPDLAPRTAVDRGGTAVISAIDRQGNGITLVQSVFTLFGSFVMDPETGILLNNRMRGFSLNPLSRNALAGGKRPAHTLSPAMVLKEGRLRFLLGTPGGPGQTITLAQVLQNCLVHDLPLAHAIAEPRWSLDLEGNVLAERSIGPEVLQDLAWAGVEAIPTSSSSPFFGSAEAIEILEGGVFCGAADFRREALVLGS
jgi:gamma-glutamyltranspeptidase/glutathione hydrolase